MVRLRVAPVYSLCEFLNLSIDINECTMRTDNCEQNCTNTVGSYNCSCNAGFSLNSNGRNCTGISVHEYICIVNFTILHTDIDECATNNGGCSQNCSNNVGTFNCSCNTGYTLFSDGITCNGD